MTAISAVIFDIGNVLLEWAPERFYDQRIGAERRKALFAETGIEAMNDRVDLGADFDTAVAAHAEAHPAWAEEIRMWRTHWLDMASPAIPHSVKLLRALREKGVPVHALSNFGVQTFEMALEAYPFLEEFDMRFISGHMRVSKPDPEIYRRVERDTGVPSSQLLFTDDRHANVDIAAARGWKTHLFEGPEGFADRLVAEGLLTAEEAAA